MSQRLSTKIDERIGDVRIVIIGCRTRIECEFAIDEKDFSLCSTGGLQIFHFMFIFVFV